MSSGGDQDGGARWLAGALWLAVVAFVGAVVLSLLRGPPAPPAAPPPALAPTSEAFALPALAPPSMPPVQAGPRGIPKSVAESAHVVAAPWAPGLRLHATDLAGPWEQHRAVIEDLTTEDRRSYAIGDLLPHGSLLVGISTGAAQVLVGDRELVELRETGKIRSLNDFRAAYEARPLKRAPALADAFVEEAERALAYTLSDDPTHVQAAIDALIAAGEPVVELVLPAVGSEQPVLERPFLFPSPNGPAWTPKVQGDVAVGILEAITGQSYGDVFDPGVGPERRREVARAWRRWWGLE